MVAFSFADHPFPPKLTIFDTDTDSGGIISFGEGKAISRHVPFNRLYITLIVVIYPIILQLAIEKIILAYQSLIKFGGDERLPTHPQGVKDQPGYFFPVKENPHISSWSTNSCGSFSH